MFDSGSVSIWRRAHVAVCVLAAAAAVASPGRALAASGDIVLYASDVATIRGTWERVASTSGAGGQLMRSPDAGLKTSSPLAAPQDYFDVSFDAPANTAYHVWMRLRASSNSPYNDSVMVQLSDSLTPSGSPVWRIGSTSALVVTLESCSGCGVSGWGWADGNWWTGDYPVVKFSAAGRHTLRVQAREDGVQIDQIVLSPTAYFTAAPGPAKDDTTIVPKTVSSTPSSVAPEVVLYASDASRRSGNWALEGDGTAATGQRNGSYDYGWSAPTPSATPADVLEWSFNAVAGVRYATWLRLRATNNSNANDSVWVQFSGSVDGGGAPSYRIGTTSALLVNLENCKNCGVSAWGWQRRAWWKADTGEVYFATSGTKTIRVQTSEDGVRIDQIVLSPVKFLNSSPGGLRDDTTIVNRDGTVTTTGTITPPASYPQTLSFTASTDHNTLVLSYLLEVFTSGANPSTAKPVASLSVGKPSPVGGAITVNVGSAVQALSAGSYVATVSAVGSAGTARSASSNTFSR